MRSPAVPMFWYIGIFDGSFTLFHFWHVFLQLRFEGKSGNTTNKKYRLFFGEKGGLYEFSFNSIKCGLNSKEFILEEIRYLPNIHLLAVHSRRINFLFHKSSSSVAAKEEIPRRFIGENRKSTRQYRTARSRFGVCPS